MLQTTKLRPIAPLVIGDIVGYVEQFDKSKSEQWLLGHCVGKSDAHVSAVLKRAHIEEYYPQIREFRPVPRRELSQKQRASGIALKRPIFVPLLPRYRLLHIDPRRRDLDDIFKLAGIRGMVCEGGAMIRISQGFIEHIHRIEIDGAIPGTAPVRVVFSAGDAVLIGGNGPFAHFNAVVTRNLDVPIEKLDSDTRIKVAILLLGRVASFELPVSEVEKL